MFRRVLDSSLKVASRLLSSTRHAQTEQGRSVQKLLDNSSRSVSTATSVFEWFLPRFFTKSFRAAEPERIQHAFDKRLQLDSSMVQPPQPFFEDNPLTDAIRRRLRYQDRRFTNGLIVVPAPKGAGKTTSVRYACHQLIKEKQLRGLVYVDFAKMHPSDDPLTFFGEIFDADASTDIYRIVSRAEAEPYVTTFFLDNVDFPEDQQAIYELCFDLAMDSTNVYTVEQRFNVLASCSDVDVANKLLTINGGSKVKSLGYHQELVYGSDGSRGLKWKREDCETLLTEFQQINGLEFSCEVQKRLVDLGVRAGTPSMVLDALERARAQDLLSSQSALASYLCQPELLQQAQSISDDWDKLTGVSHP